MTAETQCYSVHLELMPAFSVTSMLVEPTCNAPDAARCVLLQLRSMLVMLCAPSN